jgi:hypothetical protein
VNVEDMNAFGWHHRAREELMRVEQCAHVIAFRIGDTDHEAAHC